MLAVPPLLPLLHWLSTHREPPTLASPTRAHKPPLAPTKKADERPHLSPNQHGRGPTLASAVEAQWFMVRAEVCTSRKGSVTLRLILTQEVTERLAGLLTDPKDPAERKTI